MLQKGADHIRALKSERQQQQEETDLLKQQIENLNQTIGVYQSQLPATGAPVSCQRTGQTKELFENYVRERTQENWKFWIFSIIMDPLFESYDSSVSTSNVDEMCKSVTRWVDQSCSLVNLRKEVINSLRQMGTSTSILTNPASLPEEALRAVAKKEPPTND
jgi:MAX-like protein X